MESWQWICLGTGVLIAVPLLIMAGFLLQGKGAWLISGYNTMPKEKRDKYDKDKLCKFTGRILVPMAVLLPAMMAAVAFEIWWLTYLLSSFFLAFIIAILIYANTGNRFKKREGFEA